YTKEQEPYKQVIFYSAFVKIISGGFYNILSKTLLFRNAFIIEYYFNFIISSAYFFSSDSYRDVASTPYCIAT
ncbi:MAG: hypothetical protein ABL872_10430, partial [Lacibacter sp.]